MAKKKQNEVVKSTPIIFSAPQLAIIESRNERNLFMSGVGSGKTHIFAFLSAFICKNFPEAIQLIAANTYTQLSKSTLKRVFDVWKTYGIKEGTHYVINKQPPPHFKKVHTKLESYKHTISFENGALIFTASLDNYKAIDGIEVAAAYLDETKDTEEEALTEVIIARLRQKVIYIDRGGNFYYGKSVIEAAFAKGVELKSFNPLYVCTSPAKVPWINDFFNIGKHYEEIERRIYSKTDFFSLSENNRTVVISSTYHNEHNLPSGYINNLINDYAGSPNRLKMLVYGSPVAKSGTEFYAAFNRSKHVKVFTDLAKIHLWRDNLPVHISFDFNVKPYMTATVWQIVIDGYQIKIRCLKEYCLSHPRNTTEDVCTAIMDDYGNHKPGILIYGDASGHNRSAIDKENRHHYDVIARCLKPRLQGNWLRVPNSNPPLIARRDFMNKIFNGSSFNDVSVSVEIDEACVHTVADYEFVKEDINGGKKKQKTKDKDTGEEYEKYGHTSDSGDYFFCEVLNDLFYS